MRRRSGSPSHAPVRKVARLESSIRWIERIPVGYQLFELIVQVLLRLLSAKMLMVVVVVLFRLVWRSPSVLLLVVVLLLLVVVLLLLLLIVLLLLVPSGSVNLLRGGPTVNLLLLAPVRRHGRRRCRCIPEESFVKLIERRPRTGNFF